MKGIIIYTSKYGSTKQYAEWLGEDTGFPVRDLKEIKAHEIKDVDMIVFGGWVLASKIKGSSWVKDKWALLKDLKVVVFSTSGGKPTNELTVKLLESSFPPEIRESIAFFPLQGRFLPDKLNFLDRNMTKLASKLAKDDPLMKEMSRGIDGINRGSLEVILEHIKSLDRPQDL